MAIKATINSVPKSRVSIKQDDSITVTPSTIPSTHISINKQERDTIRTTNIGSPSTLRNLSDVVVLNPNDGDVLVYDEANDEFVIMEIPRIDGGTF